MLFRSGDIIFVLTKAKEKEGDERVGSQITLNISKSRFQREDSKYKILLLYSKGVYKYSGLMEYALKYEIWKKEGHSIVVDENRKVKKSTIFKNPEEFFTEQVLNQINENLIKDVGFGDTGEEFFHDEIDKDED